MGRSKAAQNNSNPPSKVNIERATAIFLRKIFIPKFVKNLENVFFFQKTAIADTIFILVVGFELFWAAFDLLVTVVPLKVALGLEKIDFWAFQKNNQTSVTS